MSITSSRKGRHGSDDVRLFEVGKGYVREVEMLYGRGEPGWLGRQLDRLPAAVARLAVRTVLGLGLARRRIVFDGIFGMKEVES